MPERSRKIGDINLLSEVVVENITDKQIIQYAIENGKNPAAVLLGRKGGLKGGKARAEKLSAEKRSEIAKKAAEARWKKK